MNINPRYKFYITHNSTKTEVFPLGTRKIKFVYDKEGDNIFFRLKMKGKLEFTNIPKDSVTDFDYFKAIEETGLCDELSLLVTRSCDNEDYEDYWNGYFSVNEGEWDLDKCTFIVEPLVDDEYRCILQHLNDEINITNLSVREATILYIEDYEFYVQRNGAAFIIPADIPAPLATWSWFNIHNNGGLITSIFYRKQITTACIDGSPQAPSGGGWVLTDNNCATTGFSRYTKSPGSLYYAGYPAPATDVSPGICTGDVPSPPDDSCSWIQVADCDGGISYYYCPAVTETRYSRNRLLHDVLTSLADNCSNLSNGFSSVRSDFFEMLPPGDTPGYSLGINYVTGSPNQVNWLLIAQKSDIIDPTSTEPATKGITTFSKLMTILREMFNVYWFVDGDYIRLEHVSWFLKNVAFDLTTLYPKYISGKNKYSYDKSKMPKHELYSWMEALNIDFVGTEIRYDSPCVNQDEKTNVLNHNVDQVTTDLLYINDFPNDISKSGFVILATDINPNASGAYSILIEPGKLSGSFIANAHLSWANLHYNYHRYNRVLLQGYMNLALTTFLSTIRTKKQTSIIFPFCCTDSINPQSDLITTGLGDGQIDSAEINVDDNTIKVELLYESGV